MMIKEQHSFQYYRSCLKAQLLPLYDAILDGLLQVQSEIRLRHTGFVNFNDVWSAVLLDNPKVFYATEVMVEGNGFYGSYTLKPKYLFPKSEIDIYIKQVQSFLDKVGKSFNGLSEYETEREIHDLLCRNVEYENQGEISHTILGAIVYKKCVCDGFTKLAKLLFDYVHIYSHVVSGQACNQNSKLEPHAWNIVKINGEFYHLDITFDKTMTQKNTRYDYFNLTDAEIKIDHVYNASGHPNCCKTDYNYFYIEKMFMHTKGDLEKSLRSKLLRGDTVLHFKIPLPQRGNATDAINAIITKVLSFQRKAYTYEIVPNEKQNVYEVYWQIL